MNPNTITLLAVGVALTFLLGALARAVTRLLAIPIELVIGDDRTEVTANGRLLLSLPSVIRYTVDQGLGLPRLLDGSRDPEDRFVKEYRFSDSQHDPPINVVHGFIASCCLRARKALAVSPVRPLQVALVFAIGDAGHRARLVNAVRLGRLKMVGVYLSISGHEGNST